MAAAADFGLTTLGDADEYDLSFALGGGPVRLAGFDGSVCSFLPTEARGSRLILFLDVTDGEGNVVYTAVPPQPVRIMDERVAWLVSDILSDDEARTPGFGANSVLQLDRTAAVKTGTTNDFHDNWTVGYTPDLVVGVWVGNASNEPMWNVTGVSGAGPIWHYFMRTVLAGDPDQAFSQPPGLVQEEVCVLSGLLPTDACPYRQREWFLAGTQPAEPDTFYHQVVLDDRTGLPADETTPPEAANTQLALDLPSQFHPWAREMGLLLLDDLLQAQRKEDVVGRDGRFSSTDHCPRSWRSLSPLSNIAARCAAVTFGSSH